MNRLSKFLLGSTLLVLVGGVFFFGGDLLRNGPDTHSTVPPINSEPPGNDTPQQNPVSVEAYRVGNQNLTLTFTKYGTFSFRSRIQISPESPGKIKSLFVERGDYLEKGDKIAVLEQTQASLDRSLARMNKREQAKQLDINRAKQSTIQTRLGTARANHSKNLENLRFIQEQFQNKLELYEVGGITENQLKKTAQKRFMAVHSLLQSKLKIKELQDRLHELKQQGELVQTRITSADFSLAKSNHRLDETVLRAPAPGVVAAHNRYAGELVKPGQALVTLLDTRKVFFEVKITQNDLPKVKKGQSVRVKPDPFPEMTLNGTVTTITPLVDPQSRSVRVRVLLDNPTQKLIPGMSGEGQFTQGVRKDLLLIPRSALLFSPAQGENEARVYAVNQGKAVSRDITIGKQNEDFVEVKKGLKKGDIVVLEGQDRLKDFTPVKTTVVNPPDT